MFYSRLIRYSSRLVAGKRLVNTQYSYDSNYNWIPSAALLAGAGLAAVGQVFCEDQIQDVNVGREEEFAEGAVKKVQIGDNQENYIVVAKVDGTLYAVGGKCPHYNLPLAAGYLDGYTLICPFHGASFDVRTGEALGAPSVQSIPTYEARVSNGDVIVRIPDSKANEVAKPVNSKNLTKRDPENHTNFVIIGGGASGQYAAETLRKEGFTGKITILSKDTFLPYDRVALTKNLKAEAANLVLRPQSFYDEYGIEVKLNSTVRSIDRKTKTVKIAGGQDVHYDKVLVASGSTARIPGPYRNAASSVQNVFTIRSAADHGKVKAAIQNAKDVVIFGSSFVGLEVATSIKRAFPDTKVTIVDPDDSPLEKVFGLEIAQQILASHRANGIEFILGQGAKSINSVDGKVSGITYMFTLKAETKPEEREVKADLILMATGAQIETDFVPHNLLNQDGSVRVNAQLQTVDPNIYAAGDVASFYSLLSEARERVEHWQVAQEQGKIAAYNMLGKGNKYTQIPFFWTNQFLNVQFAGFSSGHDWTYTETREEGNVLKTGRITYFYKNRRCIGVATTNWPGAIMKLRIALERSLLPSQEDLTSNAANYQTISQRVKDSNPCGCGAEKGCCARK